MSAEESLRRDFRRLTGREPFPWQVALYRDWFGQGLIPDRCVVPTGLGKTSVLALWLIAWARRTGVPRRLVYVVNRRTVVDQTTDEANRLSKAAAEIGVDDLAVSTLRGQFADDGQWSKDPSRPAIVCGTVDMIGSRLLFGGYRIGFRSRPLQAAFLGQDALLVHDEAHLEPAFQQVIESIVEHQQREAHQHLLPWSKLRVMALSATVRSATGIAAGTSAGLTPSELAVDDGSADEPTAIVRRRLRATKRLTLRSVANEKEVVGAIIERALQHEESSASVLIFVRSPEDVKKVVDGLGKGKERRERVRTLTGTMRGAERDRFASEDPVFARFRPAGDRTVEPIDGTVYLVCTSAGEVGIDLSSDHLVCDLAPFDSMAQRFGRTNRYGSVEATIEVVVPDDLPEKSDLDRARVRTAALLRLLDGDASPLALSRLDEIERQAAFTPFDSGPGITAELLDAWSMTTIREVMPGRPALAPFLHGESEFEPSMTQVAWRSEVELLDADEPISEEFQEREENERIVKRLELFPLKPRELLRDRSDRVYSELAKIAARRPATRVWLIDGRDQAQRVDLASIVPSDVKGPQRGRLVARLADAIVLLPPDAGGLAGGLLDGNETTPAAEVADSPDGSAASERRVRVFDDDPAYDERTKDLRLAASFLIDEESDDPRRWDWFTASSLEANRTARAAVTLETHVGDVVRETQRLATRLEVPERFARVLLVAARLHDRGKEREAFQNGLGNPHFPRIVLAKSGRVGARLGETYRHEFGSLADAEQDEEFRSLDVDDQALVLHLIAAHHGRARPHFPNDEVFDPDQSPEASERRATEVIVRFGRLQRRYGRWSLAYLESLLRAADWRASESPSEFCNEVPS